LTTYALSFKSISQRSSGSDDTIAVLAVARQKQTKDHGLNCFLSLLNHHDGFEVLKDGVFLYNAAVKGDMLMFCTFGSYLGDQPERFKIGAFSAKAGKFCMVCETTGDEKEAVMRQQMPIEMTNPIAFQESVSILPGSAVEMNGVQKISADALGVHFKSAIHDFPYIRTVMYVGFVKTYPVGSAPADFMFGFVVCFLRVGKCALICYITNLRALVNGTQIVCCECWSIILAQSTFGVR